MSTCWPGWLGSGAERERFLGLAAWLGERPGGPLEARLAPEAAALPELPESPPESLPESLDDSLEHLGRCELAALGAWLPRPGRRALDRAVCARLGVGLPWRARRLPLWALEPLGQCLRWESPGAPGWIARAGLHRLARALADLDPVQARAALTGLPAGSLELGLRLQAGLHELEPARSQACKLRRALGATR